jgi:hypothetical protein
MLVAQSVLGVFVRKLLAGCVFHAAAAAMISSQTGKRFGHLMPPSGCTHQVTAGPKVFSDVTEREQEPLRLPW